MDLTLEHQLPILHVEMYIRLKNYISEIYLLWGISRFEAILVCANGLKYTLVFIEIFKVPSAKAIVF
jgi:hypothetical protein